MLFFLQMMFWVALPFTLLLGPLPHHITGDEYQLLQLSYQPSLFIKLSLLPGEVCCQSICLITFYKIFDGVIELMFLSFPIGW